MNITDRIRDLRKTKGISQEDLANHIGVSRQAISKWESEQSVPDLDKIILLSDYFEVTTDYLLKGAEPLPKKVSKEIDASVFAIVATAMNFIGLVMSCVIWYEEQTASALIIAVVFMALGCMIYGVGIVMFGSQTKAMTKCVFWSANSWILLFIPLSLIYNMLTGGLFSPYPLLHHPLLAFPVFWLIYITICCCVIWYQIKKNRTN